MSLVVLTRAICWAYIQWGTTVSGEVDQARVSLVLSNGHVPVKQSHRVSYANMAFRGNIRQHQAHSFTYNLA